jgi:hypothetical protein
MWRYYAIATVIVVAFASVVFAHRIVTGNWNVRVETRGTPSTRQGNGNSGFVVTPPPSFSGQGGWVLSALPGCFVQQSSKEGPSELLRGDVPQDALRIPPGTTLRRGNCTVMVRNDDIWVFRGPDRLRVPPDSRLYNGPEGLTLVYRHNGRTQVRVY